MRGYDSNGATENDKYGPASGVSGGAFHRAAPGKLTGLTATPRSQQVTLNWHDPLAGDAVFNYDYRVDAGGGFPITWITVAPDSSEFTVTELTNGTTYGFQVRARNNGGEGPVSDTVTATPSGPPAAPVDLVATPGNKQVKLQWFNPSDSNIDKYQIQYGPGDNLSQWADISGSDATTTTHTVDGLANGTEYTFQLRAVDGDRAANDQAGPESSVTATPNDATPPPAKMVNVQQMVSNVTDGSEGEVKFTWDAPTESSTVTGYQYRYDETDSNPVGAWKQVWTAVPGDDATIKETTISLSGLGATIFFQLRAVGGDGEATAVTVEHSNTPSETTTTPPSKPTSLMATATPGQVALSWTAPSGTLIRFQYRQSTDDGGSWSPDWTDIPTSAPGETNADSFTKTGLTDGSVYIFEVRAVAGTADSPLFGTGARVSATAGGAPNPPKGLMVDSVTDDTGTPDVKEDQTQLALSWTAGADAGVTVTDYEYHQRASGDAKWGVWTSTGSATAASTTDPYTVMGLLPNTTYEFQVLAMAGTLASNPTDAVSRKTAAVPLAEQTTPAAPTGLTASAGDRQVTLSWTRPNDPDIKGYGYTQSPGDQTDYQISVDPSDARGLTSHTVTGLENGIEYTFTLKAENVYDKKSDPSSTATATPSEQRPSEQLPTDELVKRIERVTDTVVPEVTRAITASTLGAGDRAHRGGRFGRGADGRAQPRPIIEPLPCAAVERAGAGGRHARPGTGVGRLVVRALAQCGGRRRGRRCWRHRGLGQRRLPQSLGR